jgi:hypothetical protein
MKMKTLFAAALLAGTTLSAPAAHAAPVVPEPLAPYWVDYCSPIGVYPTDDWDLGFDQANGLAEFVRVSDVVENKHGVRWGPYTIHDGIADITVGKAGMRITVGSDGKLAWSSGERHGEMQCRQMTTVKPAWWIEPPAAPAPTPPAVAQAPVTDPQVKPAPQTEAYTIENCSPNGVNPGDDWYLGLRAPDGRAEFGKASDMAAGRGGFYTVHDNIFDVTVGKEEMRITVDQDGKLAWANGERHGEMQCHVSMTDLKPSWWVDKPAPTPDPFAPAPAPEADDPQVKPAPAANHLPLLLTQNGAYVAVSIGTTAANMLVDTGATGMTVSESVANELIANGQATSAPSETMVLAGGAKQEFRVLNISSVTVGGHVVRNVHAGVTPDGADMLLGLGVLAQVAPKFAINVANSTLDFD